MSMYLFFKIPRDDKGFAVFEKAVFLEKVHKDYPPVDTLTSLCEQYKDELIYMTLGIEYGIGFTRTEVTRTKL